KTLIAPREILPGPGSLGGQSVGLQTRPKVGVIGVVENHLATIGGGKPRRGRYPICGTCQQGGIVSSGITRRHAHWMLLSFGGLVLPDEADHCGLPGNTGRITGVFV